MAHNNVALALVMNSSNNNSNQTTAAVNVNLHTACSHLRAALTFVPDASAPAFNLVLLLWRMQRCDAACKQWFTTRGWGTSKCNYMNYTSCILVCCRIACQRQYHVTAPTAILTLVIHHGDFIRHKPLLHTQHVAAV
jgi:hypothetical protein